MDSLLDRLLDLLEGETGLYRSLLSVLKDENKAVVSASLEQLNKSRKEKEDLLLKIQVLEEQKVGMLEDLAGLFGCCPEDLTMTGLSRLVDEPLSERLRGCRSNLLALTQGIREVNNTSKALLMHSSELVKESLSLINSLIASNSVYYRNGRIQGGDRGGRMFSGKV